MTFTSLFCVFVVLSSSLAACSPSGIGKGNGFFQNPITRRILKSPGAGGQGGTSFDDRTTPLDNLVNINRILSISVSFGDYLESIQVTYMLSNESKFQPPRRGQLKSSGVNISLAYEEYLMKVEGSHDGTKVQQITFTTEVFGYDNKTTHTYGPYGNPGSTPFSLEGYVVGFHGRYEDEVRNIGIYALAPLAKSKEFGGGNGSKLTYFDDEPDKCYAPVNRMNSIKVYHSMNAINGISTIFTVLNSNIYQTYKHGGDGGDEADISLFPDETIIGVEGSTDGEWIREIKFITQYLSNRTVRAHGPFGKAAKQPFSFYGNIFGFAGSFGNYLHSFSVYYC